MIKKYTFYKFITLIIACLAITSSSIHAESKNYDKIENAFSKVKAISYNDKSLNELVTKRGFSNTFIILTSSYCVVCKGEKSRLEYFVNKLKMKNIDTALVYLEKDSKNLKEDLVDLDVIKAIDLDAELTDSLDEISLPMGILINKELKIIPIKQNSEDDDSYYLTASEEGFLINKNIDLILNTVIK